MLSSISEAFTNTIGNIANSLASLAAQWVSNEIFKVILGKGNTQQEKSDGGMLLDLVSGASPEMKLVGQAIELFNFAEGGEVPTQKLDIQNYAERGNVTALGIAVAAAMHREGTGAVLLERFVGYIRPDH